jgi:4,5-dihydroxyphthalate decarboxylase
MNTTAVTVKTNLAEYPVTQAIRDGRVTSDLVTLDCCGPKLAHDAFKAMLRENVYDAGELAIVTYLQAKAYGKPYVMIPIPISGRFQHKTVAYNSEFGRLSPRDIEGKQVGVRTYAQTTGVWARGILQHEYGVDLNNVTWLTIEDAHLSEYADPANVRKLPAGSKLKEMLFKGEIAAAIMGNDMPDDPRLETLVPDAAAAAKEWYSREGVICMNHVFVVREELSKERPDVVREIFRMFVDSRNLAADQPGKILPPIGLEANRKALEMVIEFAHEQRVIPRRLSVDELFDETTALLTA